MRLSYSRTSPRSSSSSGSSSNLQPIKRINQYNNISRPPVQKNHFSHLVTNQTQILTLFILQIMIIIQQYRLPHVVRIIYIQYAEDLVQYI